MPLTAGDKLGPYEILALVGKGGMGEVYRAHDPRLRRDVAIKTSLQQFDERFEREARAIAALNHPNICGVYDVGPDYLVMELVEGRTLKERIEEGAIPLDEALRIAEQIATALAAAHEKFITHRDLKPGNVKIKEDGTVKVLDFGLAKLGGTPTVRESEDSPTFSMTFTQAGVILGTAAYMSPEQARGKEVDRRADVWAFGVVMYEMLTGQKLFEGDDLSETLAAVIKEQPKLERVPAKVHRLLRSCLEKDPKQRLQAIGDWRLLLEDQGQQRHRVLPWIAAGVLAVTAAAGLVGWYRTAPPPNTPALFFSVTLPDQIIPRFPAISPDGRRVAMALKGQIYLRSLDSPDLKPVSGTEGAAAYAFWSPDGKSIGFVADHKLRTISASGGRPQTLCDVGFTSMNGGAWSRNGVILFATYPAEGPLRRVSDSGGECTSFPPPEPGEVHKFPQFLPDGKHFFYLVGKSSDESKLGIYIASLDDPRGHLLLHELSAPLYTPPTPGSRYGHLLFEREGILMAQPFDERALQVAGEPFAVAAPLAGGSSLTQLPRATVSSNGVLFYVAGLNGAEMVWLDRTGREIANLGPSGIGATAALSPDGATILSTRGDDAIVDLRVRDSGGGAESKFRDGGFAQVFSPDSKELVFTRRFKEIYLGGAVSGSPQSLLLRRPNPIWASDWSRDGRFLLYTEEDPISQADIWYLPDPRGKPGDSKPVRFLGTDANETQAQFSPDGRWVLYTSDATGRPEVYLRQFPSGQGLKKVSVQRGVDPRWSADGKEIYYLGPGRTATSMTAVSVQPGRDGTLEIGLPRPLFEIRTTGWTIAFNRFPFAVAPGGRFLVNRQINTGAPVLNVMSDWRRIAGRANEQATR